MAHPRIEKVKNPSKYLYLLNPIKNGIKCVGNQVLYTFQQFFYEVHEMEQLFIKVNFIFTLLCQIVYFTMLDVVLLDKNMLKDEKHPGASALLLYTIAAFFITKMKEILENYWIYSYGSVNVLRVFMHCSWKIFLELSRAVSIGLCLRDCKSLYQINLLYTLISLTYYVSTEKVFIDTLINVASYLKFSKFDTMEHLYIPIILKMYSIISGLAISGMLFFGTHARFVMFASYFIIYLRLKDLYFNYVKTLILEKEIYASFKEASCKEIQEWDDVCSICLSRMDIAKVTSCNHLFHPLCLKQCLKSSLQCPFCKQLFVH
ncbi:hypothetical protein FQR65_LT06344 [Abscondita terminalis]|nr:hypothetical protein FQR65_LT06344 [Abscondita terminalis]